MTINDLQAELKLQEEINESLEKRQEILQDLQRQKKEDTAEYEEELRLYREKKAELKAVEESIKKLKKATDEYNSTIDETKEALKGITGINMQLLDSFKKNEDGVIDWGKSATAASKTVVTAMLNFTMSLNKQQVTLARNTGYATDLNDNLLALADSSTGLSLSMEEGTEVLSGLSSGFSDYGMLSEDAQRSTEELAGRFLRMGMSAEISAKALDVLKRGLKFNQTTAEATLASFEDLSIELGRTVGQVTEDFIDLEPALARFGVGSVRVFKDLANQARSLGLTTRQAFDFTEMFDTFESSADVAGKLNAQLGLQLNSVEMMSASSEERLKILRAEFSMQGTHFNDMSRRQKQMVAEIMGTDVDVAARLFGDPMEMRKFQRDQAKDAKRVKSFISITDKWRSSMQQFFINMSPFLNGVMKVLVGLSEVVNDFSSSPAGAALSSLLGAAAGIWLAVRGVKMLATGFGVLNIASLTLLKTLAPIVGALMLIKDLSNLAGDEKQKKSAVGGLMGGVPAAILGAKLGLTFGPMGGLVGAGLGYAVGSYAGTSMMNDGETQGGGVISQPGKRPIQTRPDDTIFMGTGDIHRTLKQIADNTSGAQSQKFTISAPIQIDLKAEGFREKVIKDVMIEFNPTK